MSITTAGIDYLAAILECRDTFANVYHELTTPYTELSWALSRVMGLDPAQHVPASRWHNALCMVQANQVEDFDLWSNAVLHAHLDQLKYVTDKWKLETYRYQSCAYVSLPDLEQETTAYIDREIKRAYPTVRRNTKRYKELANSVKDKARPLTAGSLKARMQAQFDRLKASVDSDKHEADKVRSVAYELEMASTWVLALGLESEQLGQATRAMLDSAFAHASSIENRLRYELDKIQTFMVEMAESEVSK